mmetsp:Transcript_72372/g.125479  ORF Transcript_72372/g.125479 Transcript_72372/m.125479 type:complete len:101 (-) Transcript_72372:160-462(-)
MVCDVGIQRVAAPNAWPSRNGKLMATPVGLTWSTLFPIVCTSCAPVEFCHGLICTACLHLSEVCAPIRAIGAQSIALVYVLPGFLTTENVIYFFPRNYLL